MQPTLEDLQTHREEVIEKFGLHEAIAFSNVSQTHLSIARYYGMVKVNGSDYIYNRHDDSLMREDVVKWLVELMREGG